MSARSARSTSRPSSIFDPDLVVAGGNGYTPPDAIGRLRDVGIPVVVIYAPTTDAVAADVELLAEATGSQAGRGGRRTHDARRARGSRGPRVRDPSPQGLLRGRRDGGGLRTTPRLVPRRDGRARRWHAHHERVVAELRGPARAARRRGPRGHRARRRRVRDDSRDGRRATGMGRHDRCPRGSRPAGGR